jgi:hypothetical protein
VTRSTLVALLAVVAMSASACGPNEPLHVATVQLGRSLNSDNSVGTLATRFKPDDTIYVAVLTDRPGKGTIKARWSYRGSPVSEEEKSVSYNDAAATEFHIHYPGNAPLGDYRVEVEVDGMPAATREFKIER